MPLNPPPTVTQHTVHVLWISCEHHQLFLALMQYMNGVMRLLQKDLFPELSATSHSPPLQMKHAQVVIVIAQLSLHDLQVASNWLHDNRCLIMVTVVMWPTFCTYCRSSDGSCEDSILWGRQWDWPLGTSVRTYMYTYLYLYVYVLTFNSVEVLFKPTLCINKLPDHSTKLHRWPFNLHTKSATPPLTINFSSYEVSSSAHPQYVSLRLHW